MRKGSTSRQTHGQLRQTRKQLGAGVALIALLSGSGFAFAQQADKFQGLEEITITASKRSETVLEAGMSVTAITDLTLERMGAENFNDFAVRVPNLGFGAESDGRFSSNSPSIRGIFGADTTGFYIDDTPIPASMQPRVIDLTRIEVLRGPQGSLYGARSMGGTIRLITKQPDLTNMEGSAHGKLSTVKEGDMNWALDGTVNVPVVEDKFALRLTAYYGENSGIYDDVYQPTWTEGGAGDGETVHPNPGPDFGTKKNVDDETFKGVQLVGLAQLTENLSFTPKFMYQKIDADGLPFADVDPESTTRYRFYDFDESGYDRWWLTSGTFNWDVGSGSFVSTTSYFNRKLNENEEETGFLHWLFNNVPIPLDEEATVFTHPIDPLYSIISESEKYTSFSHETRYTSAFEGPLQFTAGVFYQRTKFHLAYPPTFMIGMNDAMGAIVFPDDLIYVNDSIFNTKEYAVFGELTVDLNQWLSVTGGGRYYKTKTFASNIGDGFANGGPSESGGNQSESGFNPKVLVQADVSEELNLYASASKGFRIGGINGNLSETLCGAELDQLGITPSDARTYDSDTLWSYEAGFKSKLADNRVSINGAAYIIKWSDIQQQNRLECGFQFFANAGKAESKGFEVEVMAAPVEGLTLSFALGYTDAKITDAGGATGVSVGDKIQGVPNWTISSSGEYIFPVTNDFDGMLRVDFNHYGRSYSSNNETSAATQRLRPSWTAVNVRAGILRDTWDFTVFVDNITDERANLADSRSLAAEEPGRPRIVTNRPRTIGAEIRARF